MLLGVAVAPTVPIIVLGLQGVGQVDVMNYIGGLSVPVIGVSPVGSAILSIRGICFGKPSPVQYAILEMALCFSPSRFCWSRFCDELSDSDPRLNVGEAGPEFCGQDPSSPPAFQHRPASRGGSSG